MQDSNAIELTTAIIIIIILFRSFSESMEIIPEGKNFRLLHDDELNDVLLEELEKYIPEALKVRRSGGLSLLHKLSNGCILVLFSIESQ